MSLLTRWPDTATVYPSVPVDDGYGGTKPGIGEPVTVRCRVQPSDSENQPEGGYLTDSSYRLIARELPPGPWSYVDWAGERWVIVGEPSRYGYTRRTSHHVATIKRRG